MLCAWTSVISEAPRYWRRIHIYKKVSNFSGQWSNIRNPVGLGQPKLPLYCQARFTPTKPLQIRKWCHEVWQLWSGVSESTNSVERMIVFLLTELSNFSNTHDIKEKISSCGPKSRNVKPQGLPDVVDVRCPSASLRFSVQCRPNRPCQSSRKWLQNSCISTTIPRTFPSFFIMVTLVSTAKKSQPDGLCQGHSSRTIHSAVIEIIIPISLIATPVSPGCQLQCFVVASLITFPLSCLTMLMIQSLESISLIAASFPRWGESSVPLNAVGLLSHGSWTLWYLQRCN